MKITKSSSKIKKIKITQSELKRLLEKKSSKSGMLGNFTHYMPVAENSFFVFKLGKCKSCNGMVREPNGLTVRGDEIILINAGLVKIECDDGDLCFPEVVPVKDGGYVCEYCMNDDDL